MDETLFAENIFPSSPGDTALSLSLWLTQSPLGSSYSLKQLISNLSGVQLTIFVHLIWATAWKNLFLPYAQSDQQEVQADQHLCCLLPR